MIAVALLSIPAIARAFDSVHLSPTPHGFGFKVTKGVQCAPTKVSPPAASGLLPARAIWEADQTPVPFCSEYTVTLAPEIAADYHSLRAPPAGLYS